MVTIEQSAAGQTVRSHREQEVTKFRPPALLLRFDDTLALDPVGFEIDRQAHEQSQRFGFAS